MRYLPLILALCLLAGVCAISSGQDWPSGSLKAGFGHVWQEGLGLDAELQQENGKNRLLTARAWNDTKEPAILSVNFAGKGERADLLPRSGRKIEFLWESDAVPFEITFTPEAGGRKLDEYRVLIDYGRQDKKSWFQLLTSDDALSGAKSLSRDNS